jgi:hypothetical protein
MLGSFGDGTTLAALRLHWCRLNGPAEFAPWLEPFKRLLAEAWTELDLTGHGMSGLFRMRNDHVWRLQRSLRNVLNFRFWHTIGGVERPGGVVFGAGGLFLPLTGWVLNDPNADLPRIEWRMVTDAFVALADMTLANATVHLRDSGEVVPFRPATLRGPRPGPGFPG